MSLEEEVVLWMKSLFGQMKSLSGQMKSLSGWKRMAVFDSDDEQKGGLECAGEIVLKKAHANGQRKRILQEVMQCEKRSQHWNGMMKGWQRDGKWVEEEDEKESS